MTLGFRIFLGYFVILGVGVYVSLNIAMNELKPAVRQSAEETLVESANVLAVLVQNEVKAGRVSDGGFARAIQELRRRRFDANIWGVTKDQTNHRIYITDSNGIVIFDTDNEDVGKDYSQWRDVYLTLRGKYGARSTRADPSNDATSVMHIAAPITDGEKIIGVLTIAKPNLSMQPFLELGRRELLRGGLLLLTVSLGMSFGLSFWLTRSLARLAEYAKNVSEGKRVALPPVSGPELAGLGTAIEAMRTELEGKDYVEKYVQSLTHELKAPLAAIQGASELLHEGMDPADRARFLSNIRNETERMQMIVARMLDLAVVEHRQALQHVESIDIHELLSEVVRRKEAVIATKRLVVTNEVTASTLVMGERFLLHQALSNLLDNAIAFTPEGGTITWACRTDGGFHRISLRDVGSGIPPYANGKIFERFYSLPPPDSGKKGTGLGLSFVREVALLHGGTITVENHPEGGVEATLQLVKR